MKNTPNSKEFMKMIFMKEMSSMAARFMDEKTSPEAMEKEADDLITRLQAEFTESFAEASREIEAILSRGLNAIKAEKALKANIPE